MLVQLNWLTNIPLQLRLVRLHVDWMRLRRIKFPFYSILTSNRFNPFQPLSIHLSLVWKQGYLMELRGARISYYSILISKGF